jgi:hypothetical protein
MDVTRLSLARVIELGVPISWREAGAVVFEGVYRAQQLAGPRLEPVAPDDCLITRGGEVVFAERADRAQPEAVAALAKILLQGCDDPGEFGAAVNTGRVLPFLETLGRNTTWKRRRVQIATLALRALAAHTDDLRARSQANASGRPSRPDTRQVPAARPAKQPPAPAQGQNSAARGLLQRISARLVIWTVGASSVTVGGLSACRADSAPTRSAADFSASHAAALE